jgi:hypothetical protein
MPIGKDEIRNRFGYHQGTSVTGPQHERLREAYIAFGEFLDEVLPDGRAKSTAFTNLQQSSMWANFGVAEQAPLVDIGTENARIRASLAASAVVKKPGPKLPYPSK